MFKCKLSGEPAPKVTWLKGKRVLTTTKDEKVKVFYNEMTQEHVIEMKGTMPRFIIISIHLLLKLNLLP